MDTATVRRTSVDLTDGAAIEEFLAHAYTGLRVRGGEELGRLSFHRVDAGAFSMDHFEMPADTGGDAGPLGAILVARSISSQVGITRRGTTTRYRPGDVYVVADPEQSYGSDLGRGRIDACVIDLAQVARIAAAAPGRPPAPVRLTGLEPRSAAAAAHWVRTRDYVARMLDDVARPSALMLDAATRLLATAVLETFASTAATDPTAQDRHDAHPAVLRRATAFVEEHAGEPIAVADIAAAAHVSIRAVQLAFRRHLDLSPTDYLRLVRLQRAHRDLAAADPAVTTVAHVAARWGFTSHSRFAALYRSTYGVPPARTLRGG